MLGIMIGIGSVFTMLTAAGNRQAIKISRDVDGELRDTRVTVAGVSFCGFFANSF